MLRRLVDLRLLALVTVLDVDANADTILRLNQHLDTALTLALDLKLPQRGHQVIRQRRAVRRVLANGLPADGWGPWWRDEEVLLELRWTEEVMIGQLLKRSGVSPVDAKHYRRAGGLSQKRAQSLRRTNRRT